MTETQPLALRRARLIRLFAPLLVAVLGCGWATTASAQDAAAQPAPLVRANFEGSIPEALRKEVMESYQRELKADSRALTPMDDAATKTALESKSPALIACYTPDCLKRVGSLLQTNVAVGILVGGEAQIYDFEVVIYDLTMGTPTATKRGTCEICTVAEAGRAFTNVFTGTLKEAKIVPWKKPVVTETKPPEPVVEKIDVELNVKPETATIELGDTVMGTGSAKFSVEVGHYSLRISADGYETLDVPLVLDAKTKGPVTMDLQLTEVAETKVVLATRRPGLLDDVNQAAFGWIGIGLGAGSIIGGGILLSMDGDTTCSEGPKTACPNVFETTVGGTTMVGLGTALVATGAILVLWETLAGGPGDEPQALSEKIPVRLNLDPRGGATLSFESPF